MLYSSMYSLLIDSAIVLVAGHVEVSAISESRLTL